MGKAYQKKIPQVYEFLLEDLEEDIKNVQKNGLPKIVGAFYSARCLSLKSLAVCDYLVDKNVEESKNRFYNSAVSGLKASENSI